MELLFAYIAGLLTLINPCILPILPIVLASSTQGAKHGPAALALGMSVAFVALGMLVLVAGSSLGINEQTMVTAGAWAMIGFGLILLVPRFSERFAVATAGVSTTENAQLDDVDISGLRGQFVGGILLGAVWSPCVGPTLGGAISLASQRQNMAHATLIMVSFALGVSTIILGLGYGAQSVIAKRRDWMRGLAQAARPIMGAAFIAVGLAIYFKLHHVIEFWAIETLPAWLIDFSVSI